MVNKKIINTILALIVSSGTIAACTNQTPNALLTIPNGNETINNNGKTTIQNETPVPNQDNTSADGSVKIQGTSVTEPGLITPDEYYRYKANNQIISINKDSEEAEKEAESIREKTAEEVVNDFVKNNPDRANLLTDPSPNDPALKPTSDGNFLLKIKNSQGMENEVVTLGKSFRNQVIASALKRFPSMENQLLIYKELYNGISEEEKTADSSGLRLAALTNTKEATVINQQEAMQMQKAPVINRQETLPTPQELEKMPAEKVMYYNELLIRRLYDRLPIRYINPNIPAGYVSNPDNEQGAASNSNVIGDRTGYSATCAAPSATGLYKNFDWKAKYFATSVKNQGRRGTCVAFAIGSAHEMKIAQTYSRWTNLSEQDQYFKNKAVWWPSTYGDGLNTGASWSQMDTVNYHPPFENEWLYNPSYSRVDTGHSYSNSCTSYPQNCSNTNHQGRYFSVYLPLIGHISGYLSMGAGTDTYNVTGSVAELWNHANIDLSMLCTFINLYLGRPVVLSASVTPSFDGVDANGFVHYAGASESSRGGHALHVTGYIDNDKISAKIPGAPLGAGGGYFIIKNSWGVCNGDAGYYYIPYQWIRNYTYSMLAFY
jgi:C1A family cysteine protease